MVVPAGLVSCNALIRVTECVCKQRYAPLCALETKAVLALTREEHLLNFSLSSLFNVLTKLCSTAGFYFWHAVLKLVKTLIFISHIKGGVFNSNSVIPFWTFALTHSSACGYALAMLFLSRES